MNDCSAVRSGVVTPNQLNTAIAKSIATAKATARQRHRSMACQIRRRTVSDIVGLRSDKTPLQSIEAAIDLSRQPRLGSLLRPRPIGRDRVVLWHGRACRCYACACVGRGTHEFARPLPRPFCSTCTRNLLFEKLDALAGAAIGDFGVQIGRLRTLNHRVPGSSPGAPARFRYDAKCG